MTLSTDAIGRLMTEPGKPTIVWSAEQREAIEVGVHPHLIVAGAGSGKTTVMTARILWLVGGGHLRPDQVLGLTFTNKAAGEFAERITVALARMRREGLIPDTVDNEDDERSHIPDVAVEDGRAPLISTYHSFAQRLLAEHGLRIGYEPGATLLNEVSRQQLAYRTVLRTRLRLSQVSRHVPTVVAQLLELDAVLAERLIEPQVLLDDETERIEWLHGLPSLQDAGKKMLATSTARAEVAQLVMEFREAKRRNFLTDFADQMRTAAGLAADLAVNAPDVIADLRAQASAVLLDEYQDTSVAQRRMLQSLFGQGHPIMAVGDPCQAIYGWRGASVFNIDEFTEDFPKADGTPASHSTLTEVRRCAPEILTVANTISAELRDQHTKVKQLRPPADIAYRGRFDVARLETVQEETRWVVEQIAQALGNFAPEQVAVLCRKRSDIAVTAAALDAAGIAYDVVGVTALLNRPEVADLVAVLRVLHNPADNPALIRLLAGHRWALGVRDLAALGAHARRHSVRNELGSDAEISEKLLDAVRDQDPADVFALCDVLEDVAAGAHIDGLSRDATERCAEFVAELHYLRRFIGEPLDEVIARIMTVTGLAVEARLGAPALVATRIHALDTFAQLADDYVGLDRDLSLAGFLQWLADAERFEKAP
ncbi:MAG: ATP-dependent helicase, partial [Actinobacteria bacterium]|nr:ATP-dependent helicase [Actinomycetota bacterium]